MNPLHFSDVLALIRSFKDALPLLWKNKLWKGYFAHGPVSYLSIFVVLLLSYQSYVYFNPGITEKYKKNIKDKAVTELKDLAKEHLPDSISDTLSMVIQKELKQNPDSIPLEVRQLLKKADSLDLITIVDSLAEATDTVETDADSLDDKDTTLLSGKEEPDDEGEDGDEKESSGVGQYVDKKGLFSGGFKYFTIILLNMLIGHFCGRIIGMMGGFEKLITFKSYLKTQIRVLQLGLTNWIFEILTGVAVSIFCGLFFNDTFEMIGKKIIHMFFLGYLFFDSYYDYFGLKTKESRNEILHHLLTVTVAGGVAWVVMSIPYIGPLMGPIICSVAVTIFLAREKGLMLKPQS
ncbi:MAG TPA: hypothetical protein PKA12_05685 [Saprospiraceae bacterium]|nr:hypothetical protein [Saprospiraceae bacterium]